MVAREVHSCGFRCFQSEYFCIVGFDIAKMSVKITRNNAKKLIWKFFFAVTNILIQWKSQAESGFGLHSVVSSITPIIAHDRDCTFAGTCMNAIIYCSVYHVSSLGLLCTIWNDLIGCISHVTIVDCFVTTKPVNYLVYCCFVCLSYHCFRSLSFCNTFLHAVSGVMTKLVVV